MLINLVVHSKFCICAVTAVTLPGFSSSQEDDQISSIDALMEMFLERQESCKEGDLMEELDRIEKEEGICGYRRGCS